jgi:hypothetical protein
VADDGPCFDPTCPCCSAHTKLERRYEDSLDAIRKLIAKEDGRFKTIRIEVMVNKMDRILRRAGR